MRLLSFFVDSVLILILFVSSSLWIAQQMPFFYAIPLFVILFVVYKLKNNYYKKRFVRMYVVKRSARHRRVLLGVRLLSIAGLIGGAAKFFYGGTEDMTGNQIGFSIFFISLVSIIYQTKKWN